jgi:DNA-binding beta-propeller fold protein YncE
MTLPRYLVVAVAWLCSIAAQAAEPPLVLERTIALHDVSGRIDHMAIDLARKRLLVAELGNNSVDVIDLAVGTIVHRIAELREPQGVGYAERADVILIANAGDGSEAVIGVYRPMP